MSLVDAALRGLFDLLLFPFRGLPAWVGLSVVSLAVSVGMLLVFRATSNQEKIGAVKQRIHACLFEMRLFHDDLRAILRAQAEILRHNATYIRLSLVPMLWLMAPLVLVMAQLQFHYGYSGLVPGDRAVLKVSLADDWNRRVGAADPGRPSRPLVSLEVPPGLRVETPAVWIPALNEVDWRLAAEEWGDYGVTLALGGETVTKRVTVSRGVRRRSPLRPARGLINQVLYPAEPPLPRGGAITAIRLQYPPAHVRIFGWQIHWMIVFFALSILFAFALRNRFGVTL
ncbi:MAG: hypothetical protein ACE5HD_00825 [Acidobacteriota bacterium]